MIEPVAYLQLDIHGKEMVHIEKDMNGYETKPLYTADQLHPRVKMTQAEFDEWVNLYDKKGFLTPLHFFELISNIENGYPLIYNIYLNGREKQLELLELWLRFKNYNPEETIEIVPDMKWFVRSKEKSNGNEFWYLKKTEHFFFHEYIKEISTQFDTKEEAEKWTNPLTEAVQLPVEGE